MIAILIGLAVAIGLVYLFSGLLLYGSSLLLVQAALCFAFALFALCAALWAKRTRKPLTSTPNSPQPLQLTRR